MNHTVQIAPGVALDDLWAGKMVDHMMADLHRRARAYQSTYVEAAKRGRSVCGSPKAQARLFDRLAASLGPALIGKALKTGKRGEFSMLLQFWDALPLKGETKPTRLVAFTVIVRGERGKGYQVEAVDPLFAIARHALVRGLQRGGARNADDLVRITRELYHRLMLARLAGQHGPLPGREDRGWLMPFPGPSGKPLFAVVTGRRSRHEKTDIATFVPTLLAEHQVSASPVIGRLQALVEQDWKNPTMDQILELSRTLEATRPLA